MRPSKRTSGRELRGKVPLSRMMRWWGLLVILGVSWGCRREIGMAVPEIPGVNLDPAMAEPLFRARERALADTGSADAWGRFGQHLEAAEFPGEARICYLRASELDPGSARWVHLLGLLELQDSPDAGWAHLARAAELAGSTNDASRVRLAQSLVERGRFEEAVPHLVALTNARPGHPAALLEWARVRLAERDLDDAEARLGTCLTNPHAAKQAIWLLSQVRARQGRSEEARVLADRAAKLPRAFDWPDPYQREVQGLRVDRARRIDRIQGWMAQGKLEDADRELGVLLGENPEDSEALLLAGRLALQRRQCPEAEERFRLQLRVAGESVNGLMQLSLALLCQQRWKEAEIVLTRVLVLKPDFAQAHANRAIARSRNGDRPGAIAGFRDALRCSPGDAGNHAALGEELARSGAVEDAMKHIDRALEIAPDNARARALKARVLDAGGNPRR
ncbi:MAG: tetratricopeptide repeat protein [Limisphaerales bacterium]